MKKKLRYTLIFTLLLGVILSISPPVFADDDDDVKDINCVVSTTETE